jgi:hypothetical protein
MGPPASEAQVRGRAVEVGEDVDIGEVCADQEGRGPEGGAPGEPASSQGCADEGVAERVYGCLIRRSSG